MCIHTLREGELVVKKFSASTWLLFLIPSLLGILLFLVPIPTEDGWMVTIAVLANLLAGSIESIVPWMMMVILIVAALGSLLFITKEVNETESVSFIDKLFNVNLFWTIVRILGAAFAIMVLFQSVLNRSGTKIPGDFFWRETVYCHSFSLFSSLPDYSFRS